MVDNQQLRLYIFDLNKDCRHEILLAFSKLKRLLEITAPVKPYSVLLATSKASSNDFHFSYC
jgi:hypothetical protein